MASEGGGRTGRARQWLAEERHRELLAVVVMSMTAVLTAWTGFQSTKWSGVMSISFSQAAGRRAEATLVSDLRGTQLAEELEVVTGWLDASAAGDDELASVYRDLFGSDLEAIVAEWEAMPVDDRPSSPLAMDAYGEGMFAPVSDLLEAADDRFQYALTANQRSDNYVVTTVLSATVLFFAALSTKLRSHRLQVAMLGLSVLGFVAVAAVVASFPVKV